MNSSVKSVILEPCFIEIGGVLLSVVDIQSRFYAYDVAYLPDTKPFFDAIAAEELVAQRVELVCRTGDDFGFTEPQRLDMLYAHAATEGLSLCPHEVVVGLLCQSELLIHAGEFCILATKPVLSEEGRLLIPHVQGIAAAGRVRPKLRMVTGEKTTGWSPKAPFLFCRLSK